MLTSSKNYAACEQYLEIFSNLTSAGCWTGGCPAGSRPRREPADGSEMSTMQSDSVPAHDESGITTWVVEAAVAVALFALGALVAFKSWQLGAGWRDDGPGAGYFPFYIGLLICIASAVVAFGAFRHSSRDTEVFVTHQQLRRVLTVLLPSLGFVVAVQLIGIYLGSVLFIAGFMIWVGKYHWAKSVAIALVVMALAYAMFEIWFKVPLFKGAFHLLSFLGR